VAANQLLEKSEKDRESIGYEIHDGVCQYVVAAQMLFAAFQSAHVEKQADDWGSFDKAMDLLDQANCEIRRLIDGLCPVEIDSGNLQAGIVRLIEVLRSIGDYQIELCCDIQESQIASQTRFMAFRIIQESLVNACRHSNSKRILVGVAQDGECLCIQVQDWGVGFDVQNVTANHHGLRSIKRRAALAGGNITIDSELGNGTLVAAEIPLTANDQRSNQKP
jgi:signal transduction histidine kinase